MSRPTTAEEWLAADMAALVELRESDPVTYQRLRDKALEQAAESKRFGRYRTRA